MNGKNKEEVTTFESMNLQNSYYVTAFTESFKISKDVCPLRDFQYTAIFSQLGNVRTSIFRTE